MAKISPGVSPQSPPEWTREQWINSEKLRAERFNEIEGTLSGYDCRRCRNRGSFARVDDNGSLVFRRCDCMNLRDAQSAIRASGLPDNILNDCTFDRWETPHGWQRSALQVAQSYVEEAKDKEAFHGWFIMSGRPGSGKTRLCTTLFRSMLENGYRGKYYSWRDFARKAKSVANDGDQFGKLTAQAKKAELAYFDDFWKGNVTPGDVHLAFEVLNDRYSAWLPTIISSEYTLEAIIRSDEAIGSRMVEASNGYYIDCSKAENWRTTRRDGRRYA